jgi:putative sigma-54 modulation protein
MYIRVRNSFTSNDGRELHSHIQRRLSFSLARLSDHIRSVYVQLRDVNGPRGGIDKSCTVQVKLVQAPAVVIKDMDHDAARLIDRVAERAGYATLRSLRRRQLQQRVSVAVN